MSFGQSAPFDLNSSKRHYQAPLVSTYTSLMGKHCLIRFARKPTKWWAVFLLPILLRALVPAGFMPMVGPGFSVQIVVCDGYAPVPWTTASTMPTDMPIDMPMAGMDTSASHSGTPSHHQDQSNCPYGGAPALGALPTLAILPSLLLQRSLGPAVARAQVAYFEVFPRAQSPRGPPA